MDGHVYLPRLLKGVDLSEKYPEGLNHIKSSTTPESKEDIPVTKIFAEFIASVKPDVLSDALITQLKDYIIDYVGVTVAAAHDWESTESIYRGILALGATGGSNTVILKGQNFQPQFAGLLNATLGHSMDFDDTYAQGTLHAGVSAISAGLTQAELLGSHSQQLLLAVAVGYEVICRLGRELANDAYARGFHNTGTAGIFGAVATISVLKRLSAKTIENAFGLAVSKAAGSMQYLENGSWNKRLHPGFAVHDAFVCVSLAEAGVIGAAKSLEGKFGFLQGYSPKPDKDLDYLTADLGARWTFLETALKPFPACRMTHGLIEIGGKYGSLSRDRNVEKITISLSPANLSVVGHRTSNKLHPENVVDAQFSAYFQLAHAWLYGSNTGVRCYERLKDSAIYDLSEKIACVEDVTVKAMGAKMHIQYVDGGQEQINIPFPLGEPEHPFTKEQIEDKYFGLVVPVLGKVRAEEIRDLVRDLEMHSVVEFFKLVC
ncbi:2-methylcitrate dehydratase [Talaromyces proteolyticus]|uniref:2-methylcitrate dehydratase n=1 Tax=Talaromyces proteolyticus TaxID=1131652 RepID=A0AAD4KU65_9EURO|nr:2-methylcitrate dehydratase [Talaromyces proteolyticus]KAH8698860.1 2-methylcitrate dehydratase [Talaromyces proteolyticus]